MLVKKYAAQAETFHAPFCTPFSAHQKIENISPCDSSRNVIPLQCASFVLLRVVPRSERKFQNEHLTSLFTYTSTLFQMTLQETPL